MLKPQHELVPEIQGLRAVAVLAVLFYHIWPWILPGGYVGVDVFFVISGYLITGSLLKEAEGSGRINIGAFYARRIRRLLPAATVVSLAVALAIPLFPKGQWADLANSIVASALYVQNWFLAAEAVNYLADDAKGPMNHFWSLSVEEQYYILWPLILMPVLHFARWSALSPRASFGWFVGLIGLGSLAYSVWLTPVTPGVAYFVTTTRAWELALGGALAVIPVRHFIASSMRAVLGGVGLLAIVLACVVYSDQTSFPGYAATLPTLGAAAVILASGAHVPLSAGRILNTRAFQYLGDISYSLYLWHWPVIVIYETVVGRAVGLRSGVAVFAASLALAHLSKVFVEDPFRSARLSLGRTFLVGAASIAITVIAGASYLVRDALEPTPIASSDKPRGALAMKDAGYDWRKEDPLRIVPRPEKVNADVPFAYRDRCQQTVEGTEVLVCHYGNPDSGTKVVMIGNSHATHWFPAFEDIVRTQPIYFRGIAKSACIFSLEPVYDTGLKRPYTECAEWSKNVIEWLSRERPDVVLISHSSGSNKVTQEKLIATWRPLLEMGLDVRHVRNIPWLPSHPGKCLEGSKNWMTDCLPSRKKVLREDNLFMVAKTLNVKILDFSEYFCDNTHCPVMIGGVLVYRDSHHMTATYSRTLSGPLQEKLALTAPSRATEVRQNQ
ncbi:peptidoglycan/LPS O-acetylase OafA/YrhL [Microvirga lupini]|uniref:Peptidoglycan/LPS O-acetylase OafA/YrhL n=1 Tax=Microvirga lupini TaxID=420324 RepID=A0A7W4VLB4_9HYPH|nr:acyltransferase family protein [Microvirga lupini]MBB3018707.1 peptidoglycan/LPS O-acetylase OafA/YrhL [Microvirga lupini]